jgi:hypothetical protein
MPRTLHWAAAPAILLSSLLDACGGGSAPATSAAPAAASMGVGNISSALSSQLGISATQASGGLGSVMSLAQEKLSPADFDKLTKAVPNSSTYMQAAKNAGITEPIGNMDGLNKAFSKLGIPPEAASKFGPAVADYVGKTSGASTKSLITGLLK